MKNILVETNNDLPQIKRTKTGILIIKIIFINQFTLNHIHEMKKQDNQGKLLIRDETEHYTTVIIFDYKTQ